MEIIRFIEDKKVIKKILKYFGLREVKARPPPKVKAPSVTIYLDDSESQILSLIPSMCTRITRRIPI